MIVNNSTIRNKLGLHARAASRLVQVAQNYGAEITVMNGAQKANGKSIMSVMMLQAGIGTELELHVNGDDETEAMAALLALIEDRFGEDE